MDENTGRVNTNIMPARLRMGWYGVKVAITTIYEMVNYAEQSQRFSALLRVV
jgi:hypothetical protein